jgi:hypothetical protein
LVAGAVEETNRQERQRQQQQHIKIPSHPQSSSSSSSSKLPDDQQQRSAASQSPTILLVPEMLLLCNAEAAVLQLAAADPALQQQLLGLIHKPGPSPSELLAGMCLLLRNRMRAAVVQGSTVDLDVLELASLVAAACDATPPEQQQQQQQQGTVDAQRRVSDESAGEAAAAAAEEEDPVGASRELLAAIHASWPIDAAALAAVAKYTQHRQGGAKHGAVRVLLLHTAAVALAGCPGHCTDIDSLTAMIRADFAWTRSML